MWDGRGHEQDLYTVQTDLDLNPNCDFYCQFHVLWNQFWNELWRSKNLLWVFLNSAHTTFLFQIISNSRWNQTNEWAWKTRGIERRMLKHTQRERERTRWLQVHGSYICALIDVIILVLNNRLRDKPAKGWETERERETCSGTQKNMKAHAGTHWSLVETLKNVKQIKYLKLFFNDFIYFCLGASLSYETTRLLET